MPSTHHFEPPVLLEPVLHPHHRFTLHFSSAHTNKSHIHSNTSALVKKGILEALVQTDTLDALVQTQDE